MKVKSVFWAFALSLLLLLPTGCSMGEKLIERAAEKANDALEVIAGEVQEAIDDLHDTDIKVARL